MKHPRFHCFHVEAIAQRLHKSQERKHSHISIPSPSFQNETSTT
ncbi:hypothetical protein JMJ77_0014694, partial [Colletotrichum scovillei]